MTLAQSSESAHRSSGSVRVTPHRLDHNANDEVPNMSSLGLEESPSVISSPGTVVAIQLPDHESHDASTQTVSHAGPVHTIRRRSEVSSNSIPSHVKVSNRVCIVDLVQQLRHEKYLQNRVHILQQRKSILRRAISLSARLHRLQFVAREGLLEIAQGPDPAIPFKKVLQFTQKLVHRCYSRWNQELHALDPLEISDPTPVEVGTRSHVGAQLSNNSRSDILLLLNRFRSNSTYIIRRIKALSGSHLQGLSQIPKIRRTESSAFALHPNRARKLHQQKLQTLAKTLQEYAFSLERLNPWSFLLFNVYGTESSLQGPEHYLRMSTWSTVLADLYVNYQDKFEALAPLLLDSFASIQDWHARERVELLLMDILQKGAFLLGPGGHDTNLNQNLSSTAQTPEAQALFTNAAIELLFLFSTCNGGFPPGSIQFISAVLGKLPTVELQGNFRGYCFGTWFMGSFLRQAITYPEAENMLLNFHVSPAAKQRILIPLWTRLNDAVHEVYAPDPPQPVEPALHRAVNDIVGALEAAVVDIPYPLDNTETKNDAETSSIFVCVSEIIRILDALSPQAQHGAPHDNQFVESSRLSFQAYNAQYPLNSLREELLKLQNSTSSARDIHPCDEQWMEFRIGRNGQLQDVPVSDYTQTATVPIADADLDDVQLASLKLCSNWITATMPSDGSTSYRSDVLSKKPLRDLFQGLIRSPKARVDSVFRMFWESSLRSLVERYPICDLTGDYSAVFRPLIIRSKALQSHHIAECAGLEAEVSLLEDMSSKIKYATMTMIEQSEDLKFKLWYLTSVVTSTSYADAKNVSEALTNMALLTLVNVKPTGPFTIPTTRPASRRSTASSVFEQPINATLGMLKARVEHGGPKKLSDEQVIVTKSWLRDAVVENFCTGEERIHRFCMELSSTAKAIISESSERSASPVLWCNVLFSNEKYHQHTYTPGVSSAPASTRPASVSSEPYAMSLRSSRPAYRSSQTARPVTREERLSPVRRSSGQGSWSNRLERELAPNDQTFLVGSPNQAYSTTTAESDSTFWSPQPSNTRSLTSASAYSRPPSMYNEGGNSRFTEPWQEKAETLDTLRHKLVCLLLSDLGCAIWSRGSETDAWLQTVCDDVDVAKKLEQWTSVEGGSRAQNNDLSLLHERRTLLQRRESTPTSRKEYRLAIEHTLENRDGSSVRYRDTEMALQEILARMGSQVDPKKKLQAVEDFHNISIEQIHEAGRQKRSSSHRVANFTSRRRNSTDGQVPLDGPEQSRHPLNHDPDAAPPPTEAQIIRQLKINIRDLKPSTLFRDLQYIAALLPHELSNKTARGQAIIRMGVAAFEYKHNLCNIMVTVADKLVAKDAIKRQQSVDPPETTIKRAAEFWMIAAREGNAFAQRELGMLYLSHPQSIPVLTYPLSMASEVFRHDTQWNEQHESTASKSSLCLALHWMRLAARNGDQVAEKNLQQAGISLQ